MKKIIRLILVEIALVFIISLAFAEPTRIIKFTLGFTLLFFIPVLPFFVGCKSFFKSELTNQLFQVNIIGLAIIPFLLLLIGIFIPLGKIIVILVAILVFVIGLIINYPKLSLLLAANQKK